MKMSCCAVIVAAGNSSRMKMDMPKQFIKLDSIPVIVHTLKIFDTIEEITTIIIVCKKKEKKIFSNLLQKYPLSKNFCLTEGGCSRQESVFAGAKEALPDSRYILIHDGARPLIQKEMIIKVLKDARKYKAATLAVPVKETIKVANDENLVVSTPERNSLWAIQTPQVFEKNIYEEAYREAVKFNKNYTDDCQLFENLGYSVHLTEGDYSNIKITTAEDVILAKAILKSRKTN